MLAGGASGRNALHKEYKEAPADLQRFSHSISGQLHCSERTWTAAFVRAIEAVIPPGQDHRRGRRIDHGHFRLLVEIAATLHYEALPAVAMEVAL